MRQLRNPPERILFLQTIRNIRFILKDTRATKKLPLPSMAWRPETPTGRLPMRGEVLETISPGAEVINQDSSQPVGYVDVQSAHTGYKARLWKVVTVDGEEVSREQVNSSSYKMTPRTATVGTSTSDANVYNELQAAIATGSIDHVKSVASALANGQSTTTQPSTGVGSRTCGDSGRKDAGGAGNSDPAVQ